MNQTNDQAGPPPRRPRWWPAIAILILLAIAQAAIWLVGDSPRQARVMPAILYTLIGSILLLTWALFFSRFRWRTRLSVLALAILAAVTAGWLYEIKGVTGDFVPIIGLRDGSASHSANLPTPPADSSPADPNSNRAAALATLPHAADWPQFLGPDRYPAVDSLTLDPGWAAHPPRELWRIPVGEGWSAFAVSGPYAVTQEQRGELESVIAYELATGKPLWSHGDPTRFSHDPAQSVIAGVGPRATPTIVDDHVYTMGSTGILNCLDLHTGKLHWTHDLLAEFQGEQLMWGMPASPLVFSGRVVAHFDSPTGPTLIAFDADTGSPLWQADTHHRAAYATPMLAELAGFPQIIIFNVNTITSHDPDTGRTLWSAPFNDQPMPKVAMPLVAGPDLLFVSAGYGAGSVMLKVTRDADGAWSASEHYRSRRMNAKFANMVMDPDHKTLYGLDDGILAAVNLETGERLWKAGRYGHGQLIRVASHLLITTESGELALVDARPDRHVELARVPIFPDKTWNPPALAGRYLLIRNNRQAVCLELPVIE